MGPFIPVFKTDKDQEDQQTGAKAVFQVDYDPEKHCVYNTVSGNLDKHSIYSIYEAIGKITAEQSCDHVLSDLREAKINSNLFDGYEIVKYIQKKGIKRSVKRAIVISRDNSAYTFWETICHNFGYQMVKVFHDIDAAEHWLFKESNNRGLI